MVVTSDVNESRRSTFGSSGAKLNEAQIILYKPPPKMATGLWSKVTHKGFSSSKL